MKERVWSAVWSHGTSGGFRDVQDWGSSAVVVGSDGDDDDDGNVGVEVVEWARFLVFFLDGMVVVVVVVVVGDG